MLGPARRRSSTRSLEIVLRRLLPSVVLRGRRRHQVRARWNASIGVGALQFLRCLPFILALSASDKPRRRAYSCTRESMCARITPAVGSPLFRSLAAERSITLPRAKGPLSVIVTTTLRPFAWLVTRTRLPSGSVLCAAVNAPSCKGRPLAVLVPASNSAMRFRSRRKPIR
jgi:hypothetical protein